MKTKSILSSTHPVWKAIKEHFEELRHKLTADKSEYREALIVAAKEKVGEGGFETTKVRLNLDLATAAKVRELVSTLMVLDSDDCNLPSDELKDPDRKVAEHILGQVTMNHISKQWYAHVRDQMNKLTDKQRYVTLQLTSATTPEAVAEVLKQHGLT